MDPITQQAVLATAGAAAGEDKVYVDDVFSTLVYAGAGGQTFTNGIDLATEGGMVWAKARDVGATWSIHDTENGVNKYLSTSTDSGLTDISSVSGYQSNYDSITAFNTDGFTTGQDGYLGGIDLNGYGDYVNYTFRKAPGFFDVVTYTGNATAYRAIPHNLGSKPGCIVFKSLGGVSDWIVYHQSLGATKNLRFNKSNAAQTSTWPFNNTEPTSTHFTVSSDSWMNAAGTNYVAYVFAHDDQSFGTNGDESIIKCGSYTGNGTNTGPVIDLGFEPQFVMIKNTTTAAFGDWAVYDNMRGITTGGVDKQLAANTTATDQAYTHLSLTSTGFQLNSQGYVVNKSGDNYIYMAIRRPNKPPEVGTDVYKAIIGSDATAMTTGFTVDMSWIARHLAGAWSLSVIDRLRDQNILVTNNNGAESPQLTAGTTFDTNDGLNNRSWFAEAATTNHFFKRAPGFFDVVTYTGTGSATTINHNLEAAPEFILTKNRSSAGYDWVCWHSGLSTNNTYIALNQGGTQNSNSNAWNNTAPTNTQFSLGNWENNTSAESYIAYLFASLPGISKVGTYAGTGNAVNVNCGFSSGARFILIKNVSSGDWYLWNHADGIVSGNDPYHLVNDANSTAQVTNTDYIDPLSSGFTVTSSAPAALNASGGTYFFLAIA